MAAPAARLSSTARIKAEKDAAREKLLQAGLHIMGAHEYAESFTAGMLGKTPDGKPFFRDLPEIRFSLSHSGDYIACAFSKEEIGLDLQDFRPFSEGTLRIARRWFTTAEYDALLSLPEDGYARSQLFYRLWTIKEAYLKYLGCGLRGRMDSFLPDPVPFPGSMLPEQGSASEHDMTKRGVQGQIVLRGNQKLPADHPAPSTEYLLLPAPAGYAMTLCAAPTAFESPAAVSILKKNCSPFEGKLTVYTVE